jgi:hypothetical protein
VNKEQRRRARQLLELQRYIVIGVTFMLSGLWMTFTGASTGERAFGIVLGCLGAVALLGGLELRAIYNGPPSPGDEQ